MLIEIDAVIPWARRILRLALFLVLAFVFARNARCQTPKDPFMHPFLYIEECVAEEKKFCVEFRARLDAWKKAALDSPNPEWRWLDIRLRPELRKEGNKMFAELRLTVPGRSDAVCRAELKKGTSPKQAAEAAFEGFLFWLTGRYPSSPNAGKKRRGSLKLQSHPPPLGNGWLFSLFNLKSRLLLIVNRQSLIVSPIFFLSPPLSSLFYLPKFRASGFHRQRQLRA